MKLYLNLVAHKPITILLLFLWHNICWICFKRFRRLFVSTKIAYFKNQVEKKLQVRLILNRSNYLDSIRSHMNQTWIKNKIFFCAHQIVLFICCIQTLSVVLLHHVGFLRTTYQVLWMKCHWSWLIFEWWVFLFSQNENNNLLSIWKCSVFANAFVTKSASK